MSGASRFLLACSNFLVCVISIPLIFSAMFFHSYSNSNCSHYLERPLFLTGIILLIVSVVGMIGSCCRIGFMLWFHQWFVFVMILVLFCFTVTAVVEVNGGNSDARIALAPRLQQFSDSLQMNVNDKDNWLGIRACLTEAKVCSTLEPDGLFSTGDIQKGCCKPPAQCGYKLENDTVWKVPSWGLASRDQDCIKWSNNPNTLCFDCESCKVGVVLKMKVDLQKLIFVCACLIIFLVINFTLGCCAFRGSKSSQKNEKSQFIAVGDHPRKSAQ